MKLNAFKDGKYYEGESKEVGVVLFHAYTGSPNDVNLLARELNRQGFGVLCPKFDGHGTKDVNDILNADISTWKQEAVDAVEVMQSEYSNILVFGLSLGGIFATWLMTQSELNVQGGGVFNSPVFTEKPVDVEVHFIAYVKAIYKRFASKESYDNDIDEILLKHREQIKQLENFKQEFKGQLHNIHQPYFIAQSGKDEMIDNTDAEKLQNELVNAKVDFNWFPDNTHVITVNRNRKEFEVALFNFINSLK
ncbi:alpha/beta hydrolase [Aerococcaceae bacterium DSM 111021]|nr:alpha/beta hydrolase [Aerococcaceae bacterium DSM 111021]